MGGLNLVISPFDDFKMMLKELDSICKDYSHALSIFKLSKNHW